MPMKRESHILFCQCAYAEVIPLQVKQQVLQKMEESGLGYDTVMDLCGLAARKAPILKGFASKDTLTIIACHPRAVRWLFSAGGAPLCEENVEYLNMRQECTEDLVRRIQELASAGTPRVLTAEDAAESYQDGKDTSPIGDSRTFGIPDWKPWFPVIDFERCRDCRQCLGFCLFGVYGSTQDGKVEVRNPADCKTDCPACARICPETAIIFPKYSSAPINGGEVEAGEPMADPVKVDLAKLTNGDILKVLQERSRQGSRFPADPDMLNAFRERLAHLSGLPSRKDITSDPIVVDPFESKESE